MTRRTPIAVALVALLAAASAAVGAGPTGAAPRPRVAPPTDVPTEPGGAIAADPELTASLDSVADISPADTCLAVEIDGVEVYAHRGDDLQVPASNQKLLTAATALSALGADHRFVTKLVTTAPVEGGVVKGDVHLIGGGDPVLMSELYRAVRQIPADRPNTPLETFATQLREAGITKVEGRIIADESRYDAERTVPSWPSRYVGQDQAGPLSAVGVDGGYLVELSDDGDLIRKRSQDPPTDAAAALGATLASKGIEVTGLPGAGPAPAGARQLAAVPSPPLGEIVHDLLMRSDNRMAELVTKELGVAEGEGGTTAAGARVLADWAAANDTAAEGSYVADGSGLDPGNQVSCRELVDVLQAGGGRSGPFGDDLPVAGETGTLRGRFTSTDAVGRLRGKTGSLNGVTSLAGFVDLPDGGTATYAYIVNTPDAVPDLRRPQEFLAQVLATYRPPCPTDAGPALALPAVDDALVAGLVAAAPGALALPGVQAATDAVSRRAGDLVDRCSAADDTPVAVALAG